MPFGHQAGQPATNYRRKFPAEPLTPDEVAAVIGECSPRSRTGIRNRALLTLLYRSGCGSPRRSTCGRPTST